MSVAALRMNRLTLRYADADAEQAFAREQAQTSLRPIRVALIAVAAIMAAAALLIIIVFPDTFGTNVPPGRGMGLAPLAFFAIAYAVTRSRFFIHRHQWVMFAFVCVISAVIIRSTYILSHEVLATRGYVGLLINIFVIYSVFRLRLPAATAAGVLSVCAYLGIFVGTGLLSGPDVARHAAALVAANAFGIVICYQMELATRREFIAMRELSEAMRALKREERQSNQLLVNVFPESIIPRLKSGESPIADQFADVTVIFADIVEFTPLAERIGPKRTVLLLNDLFRRFDLAARQLGVEKIETTGDGYLAVGGAPEPLDNHAEAVANFGLALIEAARLTPTSETEHIQIRVGIHTGPVFAGVIGESRFHYKIFGESVNTASRIQAQAQQGRVLVSEATYKRIRSSHKLEEHGTVELKGHGPMRTFWLLPR